MYEKLRYTGVNYLFSKRSKLYNTKSHFSDGDSASQPCKLHVIETKNKQNFENFRCSMSKYLYLFCELCYMGVKCGLGTQNSVRYTGVFIITGTSLSQGSLYRGSTVQCIW